MMFTSPYTSYPYYKNYNNYNRNNYWNNQSVHNKFQNNNLTNNDAKPLPDSTENHKFKNNSNSEKNNKSSKLDHIDILGIDLYFDDILLILLIYSLYTEGVKDIYLFFVLILLLLT